MEFGLFSRVEGTRRIRGLLAPHGEASRTSLTGNPPLTFHKGDLKVPRDPAVVGLNRQHDRFDPIGFATVLETQDAGVLAEFEIADTDEGDAWLEDHGDLVRLSPELRDIQRDSTGRATATLTGAALVTEGAFASAGLFAINPANPATPEEKPVMPEPATVPGPAPTPATTPVAPTPAISGRGLFAIADKAAAGRATVAERQQLLDAIGGGEGGLFALSDVPFDGVGGVGAAMVQQQWLGEVTDGTTYQPKYAGLFGSKQLTALAMSGWKWGVKPEGGAWAGNKAAIASNVPTIVPVSENAIRWAGGHDIAREHRDFGTPGFFEAYAVAMRESFTRWLDEDVVLTEALAAATDLVADNPAGLTIGAGWSALIDGASAIVAAGLRPTAAVVEQSVWKAMAKVPSSDTLGYLSAALGLSEGDLEGFRIVPAPATEIAAGHLLVVAQSAADVYTLPGSPIRAEAADISRGGIDLGFFGYGGLLVKNSAGIVDVAPYVGA